MNGRPGPLPFDHLLVIAPHPDDETLAVGGMMHRAAREGVTVSVFVCRTPDDERRAELEKACDILGAVPPTYLCNSATGEHNRSFVDQWTPAVLIDVIDAHLQFSQPDAVVLPPPFASHQEHRAVATATLAALRPSAGTDRGMVPFVAHYEHAADHWGVTSARHPTFYVALDKQDVEAKARALAAHASQVRPEPSERSWRSLEALGRLRGQQAGVDFAEALDVRRQIR